MSIVACGLLYTTKTYYYYVSVRYSITRIAAGKRVQSKIVQAYALLNGMILQELSERREVLV